jgi:hypothetical protein
MRKYPLESWGEIKDDWVNPSRDCRLVLYFLTTIFKIPVTILQRKALEITIQGQHSGRAFLREGVSFKQKFHFFSINA